MASTRRRSAVHPRSRGEHAARVARKLGGGGSSPLARGTLKHLTRANTIERFIPARAGNTNRCSRASADPSVHPRSRGEHSMRSWWMSCSCGFIPARAGNTSTASAASNASTVHPRSRGEHARSFRHRSRARGSSPLARGTPAAAVWDIAELRFIPARAGNTCICSAWLTDTTVHPRSRGEHGPTVVDVS